MILSSLRKFYLSILIGLILNPSSFNLAALAEGESDPLWNRPSFEKKVFRVGQRLLVANNIPDRIEFLVDTQDIRNAYASRYAGPNQIVIFKDMLDMMESDDELAAILSHEIAHITKRHTGKIQPRKIGARLALGSLFVVGGTAAMLATGGLAAPVLVGGAAALKRGRDNGLDLTGRIEQPYEREADRVGLEYLIKAGYAPEAMETIVTKFSADSGAFAQFFSSHPGGTERLQYIHQAIESRKATANVAQGTVQVKPSGEFGNSSQRTFTPSKSVQATPKAPEKIAAATPFTIGQTLLELSSNEQQTLKLISRNGYMSQKDLMDNMPTQDSATLVATLGKLLEKRLIRYAGASPDEIYVLSDSASEVFGQSSSSR